MSQQTQNASFTVVVKPPAAPAAPPPSPLTITQNGANLPDEQAAAATTGDLVCKVSGGTPPYKFQLTGGQLPPGMGLSGQPNDDGSLSVFIEGTPSAPGAFNFALTITDSTA
jgi:hypothetical protein